MADQLDNSYTADWGGGEVNKLTPINPGIPSNLQSKSSFDGGDIGTIGTGFPGPTAPVNLDPTYFGDTFLTDANTPNMNGYGPVELNATFDSVLDSSRIK